MSALMGGFFFFLMLPLIVIAVLLIAIYNRLVRLRVRTEDAWSSIDVQLKRRYDLIPNLVETVKGYAAHERGTLDAVIKARQAGIDANTVQEQSQAENMITGALRQLFALSEAYPDTEGERQLRTLAGRAGDHGEQDCLLTPALQRHGQPLQRHIAEFPEQRHRRNVRVPAQGLLRDGGCCAEGSACRELYLVLRSTTTAMFADGSGGGGCCKRRW